MFNQMNKREETMKWLSSKWAPFGEEVNADALVGCRISQMSPTGLKGAGTGGMSQATGATGGLILAGYGIWQMVLAKKHIDELCG